MRSLLVSRVTLALALLLPLAACNTATLTDRSAGAASSCAESAAPSGCTPLAAGASGQGCQRDDADSDPYARLVPGGAYPLGCMMTIDDDQGTADGLCHPVAVCACSSTSTGPRWTCSP
jgi:hypothetical protein